MVKIAKTKYCKLSTFVFSSRTPLRQLGGDWRFYDENQIGCELDLSNLKDK